jgi:hypothetical protein
VGDVARALAMAARIGASFFRRPMSLAPPALVRFHPPSRETQLLFLLNISNTSNSVLYPLPSLPSKGILVSAGSPPVPIIAVTPSALNCIEPSQWLQRRLISRLLVWLSELVCSTDIDSRRLMREYENIQKSPVAYIAARPPNTETS